MQPDNPSYREAVTEIQRILRRIEEDEVDLDELVVEVQRAADLIIGCRSKIRNAELSIKKVLDNLTDLMESTEDEGGRSSV